MQLRVNIPPLTRIVLILQVAFSFLYNAIRYRWWVDSVPFLALVPHALFTYPWVIFTATLVEQNLATLFIAAAAVLYGGKYLERAWSSAAFGKFLLVVSLLPNIFAWLIYDPLRGLLPLPRSMYVPWLFFNIFHRRRCRMVS